ncbi:penicillin-binding protein [Calidifontibacter sp. DB0510]|uniref:Penicillin-binding protein n=2 Tax=Metallococcus carri TaxID=1656884 RepID=A0A967EEQ9_9MICO|nr:penicillin-binding protein [Metallococcus carri]NOP38406.1 penicillin-binding protein [Calidifontibacter sp. DB2511S]
MLAVTVLVSGVLLGRLVQLQIVQGDRMSSAAQQINTRTVSVPAQRGRILLADGTALVTNGSTSVVTIDPTVLADSSDGGRGILTRVAALLGGRVEDMIARTKPCGSRGAPPTPVCFSGSPVQPIPVLTGVSTARAMTLLERPEDFSGINVVQRQVRSYPAPSGINAAQLIGYLGQTNAADLQANSSLTADDLVGRSGLELGYDKALRGTPGATVLAVDARGLPQRTVSSTAPVAGRDVLTHLDPRVQARAEQALGATINRLKAAKKPVTGGAAVVLDASSGAVVAMASNPSYDPSIWTGGISAADYRALTAPGARDPLLNRAIGGLQPPASTFKAITLPGAINAGIDPKGRYACTSAVTIGSRVFKNFESAAFGTIDLPTALEVSCDTVFYRWAYDAWRAQGGIAAPASVSDPFRAMAAGFGIGRRTGVDLPGEAAGVLPGRQWKLDQWTAMRPTYCRRAKTGYPEVKDKQQAAYFTQLAKENCAAGYQWQPGDAVNFAIGQGDTLVTPLRMAVAYGAIANGGTLWTPQLVAATQRPDGTDRITIAPKAAGTVQVPAAARQIETTGLRRVVSGSLGTAAAAFRGFDLSSYPLSGKTGTAEVYGKDATSWFLSFGPKLPSGRQYVVAVMIEQGGTGATAAAPTARSIWDVLRTLR